MKIIYTLFILIGYNVSAQVSVDTTSIEYIEHIKQEQELMRKAKKLTEEKNLKKSTFGNNSTSYNFKGYNYDSYAEGKYSKVAKAENWSKWNLPDNADVMLKAYNRSQLIKKSLGIIVVIGFAYFFLNLYRKRKGVD